ncbi:MAG: hypothetical protein JSS20_12800 [Proteobacteria bacterium]|nr:hypothetical protein [Pseudomonadota bacterium]
MSKQDIAAPGLILDRRKIDGQGMAMSGYLEAMTDMLGMLQEIYVKTNDRAERRVVEAIMEPLEERVEQISMDLNLHAHRIGALRIVNSAGNA